MTKNSQQQEQGKCHTECVDYHTLGANGFTIFDVLGLGGNWFPLPIANKKPAYLLAFLLAGL